MDLRSLWLVILVVLGSSASSGYLIAGWPFRTPWLRDQGYSNMEIANYYSQANTIAMIAGYGFTALTLIAAYTTGKPYVLTKSSAILLLLVLVVITLVGSLIGHAVRQAEMPQYPVLNIEILWDIQPLAMNKIVWSFLGILAGNYQRERNEKRETVEDNSAS